RPGPRSGSRYWRDGRRGRSGKRGTTTWRASASHEPNTCCATTNRQADHTVELIHQEWGGGVSPRMTSIQLESLKEREELCSLLIARVKDYAIFMLSPTGTIMTWNDGARLIKGYTRDEIIGQSMEKFYTPEAIARGLPTELLRRAAEEGRVEDEGWRVRKDGTRFWANVVVTALRDESGGLTGFAKITRDLTERRKAESAIGELSGRLIRLQDDERQRLAQQLHDRTSPYLSAVLASLYTVKE